MLKRLVAFIFILAIAGQASAGVCQCLSETVSDSHVCCKKPKLGEAAVSRKPCCGDDCSKFSNSSTPQNRVEGAAKIEFKAKLETFGVMLLHVRALASEFPRARTTHPSVRLNHARPPDLYLRHRAFLI